MATHYYLRIRANQAFNMSVQSFSYSENKQVAKGWIVVTTGGEEFATRLMCVQNTT